MTWDKDDNPSLINFASEFAENWPGDLQGVHMHRNGNAESIVRPIKQVTPDTPVSQIVKYFTEFEYETGVAVVSDRKPVGLVMREKLFQRLAFKYGYALFWNRAISNVMDEEPLIVELTTPLDAVSKMAMERHRDKVYDLVIVTQRSEIKGALTIRDVLNIITEMQMELAREANPLTGLPGNRRIEGEIQRRINLSRPFAVIYADLDGFKWFNDEYGFLNGDMVLRFTAAMLRETLGKAGDREGFIGHIGGDDFLLVTDTVYTWDLTQTVIQRFDREVSRFYPDLPKRTDLKREESLDRRGVPVSRQGISISLSVLECRVTSSNNLSFEVISRYAGELKKTAKRTSGSTAVWQVLNDTGLENSVRALSHDDK
ncbi:diguanylate cyclase domain-containing protein [Alicyclobacillus sp. SO9]|uniref:diguanylate cyclase domain-containing protein n=1 Tax=Alicyclobacillus sp. SO9 TaxID=2665646 RepID=UPI0018E7BCB1|nr:GGDEF domain-containing protein [Alicyclobacillus sp. SO9]QQE80076.1 GGDEF domain-containing protein [Alicyclobacillus sp. SO9]